MENKPPSQLAQLALWFVALGMCLATLALIRGRGDEPIGLVAFCGIGGCTGGVIATLLGHGWPWVAAGMMIGLIAFAVQPEVFYG